MGENYLCTVVECGRRRVFIFCKQKTIDNCIWNLSLKFIVVRIFCYLVPVIGKHMISRFYAYVEHSEIISNTSEFLTFNVGVISIKVSLVNPRMSSIGLLKKRMITFLFLTRDKHNSNTFNSFVLVIV